MLILSRHKQEYHKVGKNVYAYISVSVLLSVIIEYHHLEMGNIFLRTVLCKFCTFNQFQNFIIKGFVSTFIRVSWHSHHQLSNGNISWLLNPPPQTVTLIELQTYSKGYAIETRAFQVNDNRRLHKLMEVQIKVAHMSCTGICLTKS